jgi:hypothetical protein
VLVNGAQRIVAHASFLKGFNRDVSGAFGPLVRELSAKAKGEGVTGTKLVRRASELLKVDHPELHTHLVEDGENDILDLWAAPAGKGICRSCVRAEEILTAMREVLG